MTQGGIGGNTGGRIGQPKAKKRQDYDELDDLMGGKGNSSGFGDDFFGGGGKKKVDDDDPLAFMKKA